MPFGPFGMDCNKFVIKLYILLLYYIIEIIYVHINNIIRFGSGIRGYLNIQTETDPYILGFFGFCFFRFRIDRIGSVLRFFCTPLGGVQQTPGIKLEFLGSSRHLGMQD